jgi:hypothetical protein
LKTFKQFVDVNEAIRHHINNQIPLSENIYRMHSDGFYQFFIEAKRQYNEGTLVIESAFDRELLESDIGSFGVYEDEEVALDTPFIAEEDEKVEIGKPKRGGPKKFFVYVKDGDKVKKITFGDKGGSSSGQTLTAKINDPEARASFVARHKCSTQTDRTSAAYWSCRLPYYAKALGLSGGGKFFW